MAQDGLFLRSCAKTTANGAPVVALRRDKRSS